MTKRLQMFGLAECKPLIAKRHIENAQEETVILNLFNRQVGIVYDIHFVSKGEKI